MVSFKSRFKMAVMFLCIFMVISIVSACGKSGEVKNGVTNEEEKSDTGSSSVEPIAFTMAFSDNPTYPFDENWLTIKKAQEFANAKVTVEAYPSTDYNNKVTVALNAGNAPDILLRIDATKNPYTSFALSGSLVPFNKYTELTPNFNSVVTKFGLENDIENCVLADGNMYHLPLVSDKPIYNAGPLIRIDLIEKYNLKIPTTYDELENVLKVFKEKNPSSYPFTVYMAPNYFYDYSMPSFGLSMGSGSDTGSYVLSYDREKKQFFAGAISDRFKEYLKYWHRLYSEGLFDPEIMNPSDKWTTKLATGKSMATYGWYDQIAGIVGNATEPGMKIDMLPPLKGPYGAYTVSMSRAIAGIAMPQTATERADFNRLVQTVDKMFYSPEMIDLFEQGAKGVTYDIVDGKVKYKDEYVNSLDGLFKTLQIKFGCGSYNTQMVWIKDNELLKKDELYTEINNKVDEMSGVLLMPPTAKFTSDQQEEVATILPPLRDMFDIWTNAFITGKKNIDTDWDAYVAEAKSKNIDKLLERYNAALEQNK